MENNNYNEESVYYCSKCLSLRIKADIGDFYYCDKCGCTQVDQCSIFEWESLYKKRYGVTFRNK